MYPKTPKYQICLVENFYELHDGSDEKLDEVYRISLSSGYSVAINAEKLIACSNDSDLLDAICSSSLRVVDGASVRFLFNLKARVSISKVNLPSLILSFANRNSMSIDLIGATEETNSRAALNLKVRYPNINLRNCSHGYLDDATIVKLIKKSDADYIFLALGSPRQEILAHEASIHTNAFIICCGGALKVLAGVVPDAPQAIKNSYFEWLYRLLVEPSKIKRVYKILISLPIILRYSIKVCK